MDLLEFSEPGVFNYSTLLLSETRDSLYVGAREAIFELSKKNVTVRNNKVRPVGPRRGGSVCSERRDASEPMSMFWGNGGEKAGSSINAE